MKLKLIVSFVMVLLSAMNLAAQTSIYPKGAYMNIDEIKSKSPSKALDLKVIRRTPGDIKMAGGNDYKLDTDDKTIQGKTLRKELWAYSDGDTLYLNCLQYKLQLWYAAVISSGRYLVFKGGIPADNKMYKSEMQVTAVAFGAIGGAIAEAKLAMMRFLYALDLEINTVKMIVPETLKSLLADRPELLEQYKQEQTPEDETVLIKYLTLLNQSN
ncbi:MAG: DUF6563 family protein [Mangrovibacterium sp.]